MVKWYNESLPRISGGFDSLWPHEYKKEPFGAFFVRVVENKQVGGLFMWNRSPIELG
jgi:hypothetical protein